MAGREGPPPVQDTRPCFFRYLTLISRTVGIVTVIVLWSIMIHMMNERQNYQYVHWYLLAICPVITFLEVSWIMNKSACCVEEGCCCRIWKFVMWIDAWKKAILYFCFSIPCITKNNFLAIICGCMLLVCATIYLLKSFRYSSCWYKDGSAGESLVTSDSLATNPPTKYDTVGETSSQPVVPTPTVHLNPPREQHAPAPTAPPAAETPVQASQ